MKSETRCQPRRVARWLLLFLGFGLMALPTPLRAQDDLPQRGIAVIDIQRILSESIAVQTLTREIEIMRSGYRRELRQREGEFREADRNLALERLAMDPETFAQRRQDLQDKAGELQREFDDRKRRLDRLFRQAMARIQQRLAEITEEVAEERSVDLVFGKATVVLVRPDLEITEEVLSRLNETLSEVELSGL